MPENGAQHAADEHTPHAIDANWFAKTFADLYPILYAHRTVEAAAPEATFAADCVGLQPTDAILDLCCGTGRHLVHLVQRAGAATGLDYSRQLLNLAKEKTQESARLVRGDMRRLPFSGEFSVVFNFFTSFGYFEKREDNLAVVKEIARTLRPGGRFFIDYLNREQAVKGISPCTERSAGPYDVREERWIDVEKERINKRTNVLEQGHVIATLSESVKLYSAQEFVNLLAEGGLMPEHLFGDYGGARLTVDAPRMMAVGVKAD